MLVLDFIDFDKLFKNLHYHYQLHFLSTQLPKALYYMLTQGLYFQQRCERNEWKVWVIMVHLF